MGNHFGKKGAFWLQSGMLGFVALAGIGGLAARSEVFAAPAALGLSVPGTGIQNAGSLVKQPLESVAYSQALWAEICDSPWNLTSHFLFAGDMDDSGAILGNGEVFIDGIVQSTDIYFTAEIVLKVSMEPYLADPSLPFDLKHQLISSKAEIASVSGTLQSYKGVRFVNAIASGVTLPNGEKRFALMPIGDGVKIEGPAQLKDLDGPYPYNPYCFYPCPDPEDVKPGDLGIDYECTNAANAKYKTAVEAINAKYKPQYDQALADFFRATEKCLANTEKKIFEVGTASASAVLLATQNPLKAPVVWASTCFAFLYKESDNMKDHDSCLDDAKTAHKEKSKAISAEKNAEIEKAWDTLHEELKKCCHPCLALDKKEAPAPPKTSSQ